jgi:hypothetical protein
MMKTFFGNQNNYVRLSLFALVLIVTACSKSGRSENPEPIPNQPNVAEKTPVGTAIGSPEQKTIGANGGSFTTADNRIKLEFPVGALNTQTTISIQRVTNNCPGGSGHVFRITPHNTNFNKPVKLSFSYSDSDYVASMPAAMTIAYQDADGYWRASENMVKDTVNKKVWVTTNHFSDWALFKAVELVPYSTMVEPGKQIELGVITLADFKNDSLIPLPDPIKKYTGIVKEWHLAGAGTLEKEPYDNAIYTAPNAVPAVNPVVVSAVLNTSGSWQFTLVSNIFIGNEGLTFRIDNGPWMFCSDPDGVLFDGYTYSITAANLSTPGNDGVTIRWIGANHIHKFLKWQHAWPSFIYGPNETTTYNQILSPSGSPSPGGIYLHLGTSSLDYAVGSFNLGPAQKTVVVPLSIPQYSQHRIEGFFKVKWKR